MKTDDYLFDKEGTGAPKDGVASGRGGYYEIDKGNRNKLLNRVER